MELEEGIIDLVCDLKKKCIENDSKFISDLNISDSEYNFIKTLITCKNMNSKSIANKMRLSPSRVSRIIDNMVINGYLSRKNAKEDRRNININLTKKGDNLVEKVVDFREECETIIIKSLTKKESEVIKSILNKIINSL